MRSLLLLLPLVSLLPGCTNNRAGFKPGISATTISTLGGSLTSSDGCFRIEVPPGALSESTRITIEQLDDRYWFQEDVALQIPATIRYTVKQGPACAVVRVEETLTDGTVRASSQTVDVSVDSIGRATSQTITATIPTIDSGSRFEAKFDPDHVFEVTVDPNVLKDGLVEGVTTFVRTNVDVPGTLQSGVLPGSLEWRVESADYSVLQLDNSPFPAAPMTVPLGPGQTDPSHRDDDFLLTCDPGQPDTGTFRVSVVSQDFYGPGASVTLNCTFPIACTPPGGGGSGVSLPPNDTYFGLGSVIHALESVEVYANVGPHGRLPAGTESATAATPPNLELVLAGQPLGGTGHTFLRIDGVTGQVLQQEDFPDGPNPFVPAATFDAHLLEPSPAGAQNGAISLSGNTRILADLDANGIPFPFVQFDFNTYLHAPLIANDPTLGVVFTNDLSPSTLTPTISLYQPDPGTGFFTLNEDVAELSSALRSVASNATATEFVGLRTSGGLVWIQPVSGSPAMETLIAMTPAHHGRIAWDPVSGIGAFSDFVDSTVTAFSWAADGTPPAILDTATVGDGPVGISVLGHRIAAAGFNDDTLTRMELDPVTGLFTTVDILPNPFAAQGASAPGHITLVTPEAAAVSYNLSNGVGVLPHFFASAP